MTRNVISHRLLEKQKFSNFDRPNVTPLAKYKVLKRACSFLFEFYYIPSVRVISGTDSRLGVGFRLGEHADFQVLVELGPQKETDPIGNDVDSKRKRAVSIVL